MMNKQQLTHLQQQAKLIIGKARLITDEINYITDARPMAQITEVDLLALQTQVTQLESILTEIEALAKEGYYYDDGVNEQACLGRIIAMIKDTRGN